MHVKLLQKKQLCWQSSLVTHQNALPEVRCSMTGLQGCLCLLFGFGLLTLLLVSFKNILWTSFQFILLYIPEFSVPVVLNVWSVYCFDGGQLVGKDQFGCETLIRILLFCTRLSTLSLNTPITSAYITTMFSPKTSTSLRCLETCRMWRSRLFPVHI